MIFGQPSNQNFKYFRHRAWPEGIIADPIKPFSLS
jgi:hypothetical protein